jgi:hypothetical protein
VTADDYQNRRRPTRYICPRCLRKDRQSVVMAQPYGGSDWRLTCSDYSVCPYSITVEGCLKNGEFNIHGDLHGPDTPIA